MRKNSGLNKAKKLKKDEFYTLLKDIEKELIFYKEHFKNKIIYCNCDSPEKSAFWEYFHIHFKEFDLKEVLATSYVEEGFSFKYSYSGGSDNQIDTYEKEQLKDNGDFRSQECINLLKYADIVITNPPFSLFRDFVKQLIQYEKKFLIIGNINVLTYKEIFPLIKEQKVWLGMGMGRWISGFKVPNDYNLYGSEVKINEKGEKIIATNNCLWLTNLDHKKRHEELVLTKKYTKKEYPKYDNFNAINVDRTVNIPKDYFSVMGVPITFLDKYNPDQFEIVGWSRHNNLDMDGGYWVKGTSNDALLNGKVVYRRILIRRKI